MVVYPKPIEDSGDEARFDEIAAAMADENGYSYGQISRVIYTAEGSSSDYFYWRHKSLSIAIELGQSSTS